MRYRPRSTFTPDQPALPLLPVALRRVDPARNVARFYSPDVERDLFGCVVPVRRWGWIGTAGEVRLDEDTSERSALVVMGPLENRKLGRGDSCPG